MVAAGKVRMTQDTITSELEQGKKRPSSHAIAQGLAGAHYSIKCARFIGAAKRLDVYLIQLATKSTFDNDLRQANSNRR